MASLHRHVSPVFVQVIAVVTPRSAVKPKQMVSWRQWYPNLMSSPGSSSFFFLAHHHHLAGFERHALGVVERMTGCRDFPRVPESTSLLVGGPH